MRWKIDWRTFLGEQKTQRALWGIIVLGFALRLFFLWNRGIWFDEAASLFVAQKGYLDIITSLGTIDFLPPLYFLLLHTWTLISQNMLWIELFSVLASTAAIFVIFRWGTALYNHRVGLFAAFLFAISCLQVRFAQEIRMYSLAVLLVMLSNYYFAKVTREERFREGYSTWAKYAIVTALSLYTHYYALFSVLVQNVYMFFRYRDRSLLKVWSVAQAAIALLFLPWVPSLIAQIRHLQEAYWIPKPSLLSLFDAFVYLGDNIFGFVILGVLALGGLISLARIKEGKVIWRSEKRSMLLLLLIVLPILVSFVISIMTKSIFTERYFILFAPALVVLAAKGLSHVTNTTIKWGFLIAAIGSMALCLGPFYASANTDMRDAARFVEQRVLPEDVVLHVNPATFLPFQIYHGERSPNEFILSSKPLPTYLGGNYYGPEVYISGIRQLQDRNASRLWIVDKDRLNPKVERALEGVAEEQQQGKFGEITITLFTLNMSGT